MTKVNKIPLGGGLAQLVERLLCKQDVSGSSPLTSIIDVAIELATPIAIILFATLLLLKSHSISPVAFYPSSVKWAYS
jgi:hypothetical protein